MVCVILSPPQEIQPGRVDMCPWWENWFDPSGHFKRRLINLGCVPTVRRAPGHVATEEHKEKAAVAGQEGGKNENNEQAKDDKEKPEEVAAVAAAEKVKNKDYERAEEVAAVAPAEEVKLEAVKEEFEPDYGSWSCLEELTTDRKEDGAVAAKTDNKTDDNKDAAVAAKTDDKTEFAKEEEVPKLEMDAPASLMDLVHIKQKPTDMKWWIRGVHQVLLFVGTSRHGKGGASKGWNKRW